MVPSLLILSSVAHATRCEGWPRPLNPENPLGEVARAYVEIRDEKPVPELQAISSETLGPTPVDVALLWDVNPRYSYVEVRTAGDAPLDEMAIEFGHPNAGILPFRRRHPPRARPRIPAAPSVRWEPAPESPCIRAEPWLVADVPVRGETGGAVVRVELDGRLWSLRPLERDGREGRPPARGDEAVPRGFVRAGIPLSSLPPTYEKLTLRVVDGAGRPSNAWPLVVPPVPERAR